MFRRRIYFLTSSFGVHWRLNKSLIFWLGIFALAGIVIGILTIANPRMLPEMISRQLLDSNIMRVIMPNTTFGALMMGRAFYFLLFAVVIFVFSLFKWTVWLVFVMAAYRGFTIVINLWWVVAIFGMGMGFVLFLIYFFILIAQLLLTFVVMVYCVRECSWGRRGGLRGNLRIKEWYKPGLMIAVAILALALVEWFMFWLILSRFVFVVPPFV